MPALDLLLRMQMSRTHMALVIDEYGGTDGLVSIEDVVESIVGDIEDEHDETETPIHPAEGGAFIIEARASLDEVSEALGFDFASLADAEEVDTIGGLVTASAGRVPSRGEILKGPGGFEYEILDADPRRIKRMKLWPLAARTPEPGASPARGEVARRQLDQGCFGIFRRPLPDRYRNCPEGGGTRGDGAPLRCLRLTRPADWRLGRGKPDFGLERLKTPRKRTPSGGSDTVERSKNARSLRKMRGQGQR